MVKTTDQGTISRIKKCLRECGLTVFSVCCAVIAIGISITLAVKKLSAETCKGDFDKNRPATDEFINCIDCKSLLGNFSQGQENNLDLFKQHETEGPDADKKCCPLADTEVEEILNKIMDLQDSYLVTQTTETPKDTVSGLPIAHKSLLPATQIPNSNTHGQDTMHTMYLNVSGFNQQFEFVREVQLVKDGYLISHPGMYFVYCSIHFRNNSIEKPETWYLHVVKDRPTFPKLAGVNLLLKAIYTVCQKCELDETVFTGGVFHLISGDKIQVRLTGLNIVDFNGQSTFFGVVMLAN